MLCLFVSAVHVCVERRGKEDRGNAKVGRMLSEVHKCLINKALSFLGGIYAKSLEAFLLV